MGFRWQYKGNDIRFFRTKNGEVYGFAYDGKIYIDERIASVDTPIHEFTHHRPCDTMGEGARGI